MTWRNTSDAGAVAGDGEVVVKDKWRGWAPATIKTYIAYCGRHRLFNGLMISCETDGVPDTTDTVVLVVSTYVFCFFLEPPRPLFVWLGI